jgi:hypothetical protein
MAARRASGKTMRHRVSRMCFTGTMGILRNLDITAWQRTKTIQLGTNCGRRAYMKASRIRRLRRLSAVPTSGRASRETNTVYSSMEKQLKI